MFLLCLILLRRSELVVYLIKGLVRRSHQSVNVRARESWIRARKYYNSIMMSV